MTVEAGVIGVGYEGTTIDDLISGLSAWKVNTLIDVRLNALSRKPGFSKNRLRERLAESGIDYVHMPELGNERENRVGYSEPDTAAGHIARTVFRQKLANDDAQAKLGTITELATSGLVAVLCFEKNERECHRHEVLGELRERLSALVDA